ncbi:BsuPI-related putative proteinase inhibitor [Anaerosolibacter sp.]|uniref:BsuPI-related putative proteinase inhibitor n=1 Tax=Anaerosolibacter sp. TaxID=1872527 RepID=UPI0039F01CB3
MKKVLLVVLIILLIIARVGCLKVKDPIDEAKEVVESFMAQIYKVEDFTILKLSVMEKEMDRILELQEKLRPYMTERMEKTSLANRDFTSVYQDARRRQVNIAFEGVEFESVKQEKDSIYVTYAAKIKLTNPHDRVEYKTKRGYMKMVTVDGEWKIDYHKAINYPFELLGGDQYSIETEKIKNLIIHTTGNGSYSQLENHVDVMGFAVHNNNQEKVTLRFPNAKIYELILYQDGKEVWQYGDEIDFDKRSSVDTLEGDASLIFSIDYPWSLSSGEYEFAFYLNAEGWENKEPLRGKILINKEN